MRILYIRKLKQSLGGVDRSIIQQIKALRQLGAEAAVAVANRGPIIGELRDAGIEVFLPKEDLLEIGGKDQERWQEFIASSGEAFAANIFYPQQTEAILSLSDDLGPIVGAWHSHLFDWISDHDAEQLRKRIPGLASRHAISHGVAEELRQLGAERVTAIFSPVSAEGRVAKARVAPRDPRIVFVARADRRKGLDILLRALPKILEDFPQARLKIVGHDGNIRREHGGGYDRDLARDLGVQKFIDWAGMIPHTQALQSMSQADLLVSASRFEGLPIAVLEAHALALPVVATSASAEAMRWGGAGIVVPPENNFLLAQAVVADLSDSGRIERARKNRRWVTTRYSGQRLAQIILDDFRAILLKLKQ